MVKPTLPKYFERARRDWPRDSNMNIVQRLVAAMAVLYSAIVDVHAPHKGDEPEPAFDHQQFLMVNTSADPRLTAGEAQKRELMIENGRALGKIIDEVDDWPIVGHFLRWTERGAAWIVPE